MKTLLIAFAALGVFFSTPAQAPTEWCWQTKTWLQKELPRRIWGPDTRQNLVGYYRASDLWKKWRTSCDF